VPRLDECFRQPLLTRVDFTLSRCFDGFVGRGCAYGDGASVQRLTLPRTNSAHGCASLVGDRFELRR
jgi:hypothetical protein